jgi:hypothetical protein
MSWQNAIIIVILDNDAQYYLLDDLYRPAQTPERSKRQRNEITMSHSIAMSRKPAPARIERSGRRIAEDVRIVASIA